MPTRWRSVAHRRALSCSSGLPSTVSVPRGSLEAVDAAQQRALAGAALADDRDHLARRDAEVDALEHLVRAVALAQAVMSTMPFQR
jgi:hypothetical protein